MDLQKMIPNQEIPNVLKSGMDASLVDESRAVDCVLKAGGVSVHHPNIVHGSNANVSDLRRCGLTIRYIPATTRIQVEKTQTLTPDGRWHSAFLLRGEAAPGVNDYQPWPKWRKGEHMPFRGCEAAPWA
jgi:ectoine hydroxylase-related dioxygenase (phytanoyl-CoA dioxygenase family)